ncbi:glycosyltransferase [Quadrisphaera granulorum]|uniref:glycosyltransferase n=1 Tax=Quadrisphaera granulorum TaxID=317664 RepID=UPI000D6CEF67|nr:glycosyltransferase [Quadrisphaera granulorum]
MLTVIQAMLIFAARLGRERFDGAVSTGSGIALACLPVARVRGIPTRYIESMGRTHGPSMTGRLLHAIGGTAMYTQSPRWARGRWQPHPSALTSYRAVPTPRRPESPRLFVTLGTIGGYRFDALVDAVLATGLADSRTVWQLGTTTRDDLPGSVHTMMNSAEFEAAASAADVVISHAGVGTLLTLLDLGLHPLMVGRRAHRGEHVDDHQADMEHLLDGLSVGRYLEVEQLTADVVRSAADWRVTHGEAVDVAADQRQIDLSDREIDLSDPTKDSVA